MGELHFFFTRYYCFVPISEDVHKAAAVEESSQDKSSAAAEWSNGPRRPVNPITANGHASKRTMADIPGNYENTDKHWGAVEMIDKPYKAATSRAPPPLFFTSPFSVRYTDN